jgi:Zn finger protein HypA/HybF involved in hydrogenase expression
MNVTDGLTDIGSALGALQSASNIVKTLTSLRLDGEKAAKLTELNREILAAQTGAIQANAAQAHLIERVRALEKQIANFETWDTEKEKYQLKSVSRGAFAYVPKHGMETGEPAHWLCANCYQNRKKSLLQYFSAPSGSVDFDKHIWACGACKSQIKVSYNVSPGFEG